MGRVFAFAAAGSGRIACRLAGRGGWPTSIYAALLTWMLFAAMIALVCVVGGWFRRRSTRRS